MLVPGHSVVFCIVPAYNEQAVIRGVLQQLLAGGYEVVVIDDGSAEDMTQYVEGLPVHFLQHAVNLGQGAALQTGIDYALEKGAQWLVTFDADGQHDVKDIEKLLQPLQSGAADVALGSRFLEDAWHNASRGRRITLQLARRINYFFTGLMLSDAHNGMRAFSRAAAQKITITENRMAHATEILIRIRRARLRYREVPVHILYTDYSREKGQSFFSSIRIFFDLVLHKLFE
jgi:glycosyltransferase involved in cell wall biosynthesis